MVVSEHIFLTICHSFLISSFIFPWTKFSSILRQLHCKYLKLNPNDYRNSSCGIYRRWIRIKKLTETEWWIQRERERERERVRVLQERGHVSQYSLGRRTQPICMLWRNVGGNNSGPVLMIYGSEQFSVNLSLTEF